MALLVFWYRLLVLSGTLLSTSNETLLVPLWTTANGQGPTLAAGPTLCDLPLYTRGRTGKSYTFKYLGTSIEEEGDMETEVTRQAGAGWRNWKKYSGVGAYCATGGCQRNWRGRSTKNTDQASMGQNMGYTKETRQTDRGERDANATMGVPNTQYRPYKIRNEHIRGTIRESALNIKLLEPLAQGASRFEKLLAPPKSTGPPKIHWPPFFSNDVKVE